MVKLVMDEEFYIVSSLAGLPYVENYIDIISYEDKVNNKCIIIMEEFEMAARINCSEIESYMTKAEEEKENKDYDNEENTKLGDINVTVGAIASLTGATVSECYGVVGMASKQFFKDGFAILLKQDNFLKVLW